MIVRQRFAAHLQSLDDVLEFAQLGVPLGLVLGQISSVDSG
jgi:hypothetical protein